MAKDRSTTIVDAPVPPPRPARPSVRPFLFPRLEKITRAGMELTRRLEWMLPEGFLDGELGDEAKEALRKLFDEDVALLPEHVQTTSARALRKIMGDPAVLGVVAPSAHGARGLVEVELPLAHAIVDVLLGAAPGDSVAARPLTEIEQGVLSYVILEIFRALTPAAAEGRYRLRLERMVATVDEGLALFADELSVVVVEIKLLVGAAASGYVRLLLPASEVQAALPPEGGEKGRERWRALVEQRLGRLAGVKIPLRAEIGRAELTAEDIGALRPGDVMLVDEVSLRADKGEGGQAKLRTGAGRAGHLQASVELGEGGYQATIEKIVLGPDPVEPVDAPEEPEEPEGEPDLDSLHTAEHAADEDEPEERQEEEDAGGDEEGEDDPFAEPVERTAIFDPRKVSREPRGHGGPMSEKSEEGAGGAGELLSDVPMQVVVELSRIDVTAEELVGMRTGKVLELGRGPGEPVDLSVNGRIVARGELVEVEGQLGVRIIGME